MVMKYNQDSRMVLVLEDDDKVFEKIENFLSYSNFDFKHYISWGGILSDFRQGNLEYRRIILDNQVPKYDDRKNMLIDGGLEVAKYLIKKCQVSPFHICLHTSSPFDDVKTNIEELGINYVKKKDWTSLEKFLNE